MYSASCCRFLLHLIVRVVGRLLILIRLLPFYIILLVLVILLLLVIDITPRVFRLMVVCLRLLLVFHARVLFMINLSYCKHVPCDYYSLLVVVFLLLLLLLNMILLACWRSNYHDFCVLCSCVFVLTILVAFFLRFVRLIVFFIILNFNYTSLYSASCCRFLLHLIVRVVGRLRVILVCLHIPLIICDVVVLLRCVNINTFCCVFSSVASLILMFLRVLLLVRLLLLLPLCLLTSLLKLIRIILMLSLHAINCHVRLRGVTLVFIKTNRSSLHCC